MFEGNFISDFTAFFNLGVNVKTQIIPYQYMVECYSLAILHPVQDENNLSLRTVVED